MISQERLRELLDYNPDTGEFKWLRDSPSRKRGTVAGTLTEDGYIRIKIEGCLYRGHRLAFMWMTGVWPEHEVDHSNRVRSDNRWSNLRQATKAENQRNTVNRRNGTSGFKGVTFMKRLNKWQAHIYNGGKLNYLGVHQTAELAARAYAAAAEKLHGEFANHAFKI